MNKKEIKRKLEVLQELETINPEFPLKWAICYYHIAMNEGITIQELSQKTGYPKSTLSRIVYELSGESRYRKQNIKLIKTKSDELDQRLKRLFLNRV